jgi:hypothetical protein
VDQQLLERELRERVIQALGVDPAAMLEREGGLAVTEDPPVPEQLLEHPVASRGPRAAQIVAAPEQVPEPLGLGRRREHEAQQPGAIEPDELLGVAAVGLDPVTGADRDQRRRDHVTRDRDARQQPPQREPARARLVADRQARRPAEPVDEATNRALGRLDPRHLRLAARRRQRRGHDRELMNIQADPHTHVGGRDRSGNVRHGWSSTGRMRLWPRGPQHRDCPTRERCDARGPASSCVHPD